MGGMVGFVFKGIAWGIFWVYGFSIVVGKRPLFSYLNEYLVKNSIVESIDRSLADALDDLRTQTIAGREATVETIKKL